MESPLEFASSLSADFIASSLPFDAKTLLDIGCGDGLITRQVQQRGYTVVAIDASLKGIERSKKNGVEAIHSKLEDFSHAEFDGIYMSRSLHHMPPLEPTLEKVDELLSAGGTLIIEDFGIDMADQKACAWLFEQSREIISAISAQREPVKCEFHHEWLHENITSPAQAYERWQKRYSVEHQLWLASQMLDALKSKFDVTAISRVPYMFRFICDLLPATPDGAKLAREVFSAEQVAIENGKISAVGLRVVATKR